MNEVEEVQENDLSIIQKMNGYAKGSIKYFGAHPMFPKECKMTLRVNTDSIKFGTMFKKDEIPLDQITHVSIETEEEIIERFTATRIALFGPFALAFKKRKVNKEKYLVIETEDFTLTFEGKSLFARKIAEKIYTNIKKYN